MADDGPGTPGVVNPVVFFDLVLGGAWNGFTHLHPTLEVVLCACHGGCQPITNSRVRVRVRVRVRAGQDPLQIQSGSGVPPCQQPFSFACFAIFMGFHGLLD